MLGSIAKRRLLHAGVLEIWFVDVFKERLGQAFVKITSMQNSREIDRGDIHAGPFCFYG